MKRNLLKSMLLVMALVLGVGMSWADVQTKTIDFEDGNAVFTGRSRCTISVVDDETLASKVLYMKCAGNAQNGYSLANLNLVDLFPEIDKAAQVNVKMKYWSANGSRAILTLRDATLAGADGANTGVGKTAYGTKYGWFRVGSDKTNGIIQNTSSAGNLSKLTDQWLDLDITINIAANTVDYTIKNAAGETVFEETGAAPYSSNAPARCSQIELWGYINNSEAFKLDNVEITVTASDAAYAPFTVKYVDANGTEIIEAQNREGEVGKAATLLATDHNAIYANNKKYIYVSDNAAETIVAEDGTSVVTITFREAATYSFTAVSNIGTTLYEGTGFEGDDVFYYAPYYILNEGTLYGSPSGLSYGQGKLTLDADGKIVTINYTADATQNAVFYSEAENIPTLTPFEDQYTLIRMSNGKVGYATEAGSVITTLAPGKYTLTSATRAGSTTFSAGNNSVLTISSTGSVVTTTSDEFAIYGNTDITVSAGDNKNYFDYVLIRKTADVSNEEIAAADYAKWEDLCTQLTAAMAGNEEYITPDTRMAIETFMGETYPTLITQNLEAVAETGVYEPVITAQVEAMVAEWIAEINGIKNGEIALYTEKGVVTDGTINKAMPFFNTSVDVDVYANNSVVIKGWDGVEGSDLKVVYANVGTLNDEGESRVAIIGLEQTVNGMVVSVPQEDEEDGGVVSVTLMPQAGDYVAFDVQLGEEMTSAMVGTGEETGMGVVSLYGAWYGYPESPTGDDEIGDNMGVADAVAAHYMVQWPAEPIVIPAEMLYTAKAETVIDEEWGTLVVDPMRDITVEVYDDNSVIIRAVGGVEGYDLKVAYDAEENVTALTSIVNGKENTYTNGYANIYTDKGKYFTAYIAEGYCYAGEEDGEGYVLLSVFNQNGEWGYDYYIGWPQATVYTLAELKAIEVSEEDPGLEVNVYLDNAKVTLFSAEQGLGFIQDDEVGVILGAFDDIEGLEAGKAITGTVAGGWMNYGYGPMFVITDASEAEFTDAEATPKAIATFDDLATEDCRLVKITDTEATPITVEDGTIYIGEDIMVGDLFDEPFDVPEVVKSVTGIYAMGAMLYIRTADDIEGITDGIKNIATENAANGAIFNLAGQKVNANFKGIVIKNGKKALVK